MVLGAFVAASFAMSLSAASYKFTSTWKAPGVAPFDFAGRKVAALVITTDESLRISAEEALACEITARGPQGIARSPGATVARTSWSASDESRTGRGLSW
jgi:hypothetical protein